MNRLLILTLCLLVAACADDRMEAAQIDEARTVGWYFGTAERCGPEVRHSNGVPSLYDDSLKGGPLHSAFMAGYLQGKNDTRPCVSGVPGR